MYKLKPGQFIYREGIIAAKNIYVIMYGSFQCQTKAVGIFGSMMCIGHTLGEEIIFSKKKKPDYAPPTRTESVSAKSFSCVLQIPLRAFQDLRLLRERTGGANAKDFIILKYILENHYVKKNEWRE